VNPTQAKTGLEWGTQHLLPVEKSRLERGPAFLIHCVEYAKRALLAR
jgi:hypothetical protein